MQLFGLSTLALGALLSAVTLTTVALYLLKQRRRRHEVASLELWETLLLDRQSSQFFLRLRHLLSLLLALCIAWLLAFALSDPRVAEGSAGLSHRLLLIDAGLTMQATDVPGGRLGVALQHARRLTGGDSARARTLIAQLDGSVTALCPMTDDGRTLHDAVGSVVPTDLPTDFEAGYRYALDVLSGKPQPELVLISDRPEPPSATSAAALARAGVRVSFEPVGRRNDNVAITSFAVRRYPLDRNRSELLVELHNAGGHAEPVRLVLLGDGAEIDAQALTLAPGASAQRIYADVPAARATLEARLLPAAEHDDLAVDDRAYAVLPERRRTRVLCVTDGNRYLEAALLLDEYLDVDLTTPRSFRSAAGYDVAIFDRTVPQGGAGVPALYLGPPASTGGLLAVKGTLDRPAFDRLEAKHPVLRNVALRDVNVARALRVAPEQGDRVLAADARGPLIVSGTRASQPFVALTFDLRDSDLPLRTAWPMLLLNAIEVLTARAASEPAVLEVGRPQWISVPADAGEWTLGEPGGARRALGVSSGLITLSPQRAGFYTLRAGAHEHTVAVNLRPQSPRDLTPRTLLQVGSERAARPESSPARVALPTWAFLLLAALAALLLELFTFHRRWTV